MAKKEVIAPPRGDRKYWQIKDFPSDLREAVTRQAAGQGVTVAEWLVAYFIEHGLEGIEITRIERLDSGSPYSPDTTSLRDLADTAEFLYRSNFPGSKSASLAIVRAIRQRFAGLQFAQPPRQVEG